jgi:AcrR family transcriptional regulator
MFSYADAATPASTKRERTRAQLREIALRSFRERGYDATTIRLIADEAGVSVETIYNGFGSKKGLLEAARDFSIAGDAEPIPFLERPEFRAMGDGALDERVARAASVTADIHGRSAGVWKAIIEAASADEEVDGWRLEQEAGRRDVVRQSIALVLAAEPDEALATMCWVLYGPETYLKLVHDFGFSRADYEAFLVDATTRLIAGGPWARRR